MHLRAALALLTLTLIAGNVVASERAWKGWQGGGGLVHSHLGSYFDGLHWAGFQVPSTNDEIIFDVNAIVNPAPDHIYFGDFDKRANPNDGHVPGGHATAATLDIRNGTWTFNFNPFDDPQLFGIDQDAGSLSVSSAEIEGNLTVRGEGILSADSLLIAETSNARLEVLEGAEVQTVSGVVGVGRIGTILVADSDSKLTASSLLLGDGGTGQLRVSNGGRAEIFNLSLGSNDPSLGEVIATGAGSVVEIETIFVGSPEYAVSILRAELDGALHFTESLFLVEASGSKLQATSGGRITVGSTSTPAQDAVTVGDGGYFIGTNTTADVVVEAGGVLGLVAYSMNTTHEVIGDVTIQHGGELNTYIGEDFDDPNAFFSGTLAVSGQAELGGSFHLNIATDFAGLPEVELEVGDRIEILQAAGGVTGRFISAEFLPPPQGLAYKLLYEPESVTLAVVADLAGDFNLDGVLDGADLLAWQRDFGMEGALLPADGDANGVVDHGDLAVWKGQMETAGEVAVSIPEPTSVLLTLAGVIGFGERRRRAR